MRQNKPLFLTIICAVTLLLTSCSANEEDYTQEEIDSIKVTVYRGTRIEVVCNKWPTALLLLGTVVFCLCTARTQWVEGTTWEDKRNIYNAAGAIIGAIGTGVFHKSEGEYDSFGGPMGAGFMSGAMYIFIYFGVNALFVGTSLGDLLGEVDILFMFLCKR